MKRIGLLSLALLFLLTSPLPSVEGGEAVIFYNPG